MSNRLQTILETVQQILSEKSEEGSSPNRREKDFTPRFKKGSKSSRSPRRGHASHAEENEAEDAARRQRTHRVQ